MGSEPFPDFDVNQTPFTLNSRKIQFNKYRKLLYRPLWMSLIISTVNWMRLSFGFMGIPLEGNGPIGYK